MSYLFPGKVSYLLYFHTLLNNFICKILLFLLELFRWVNSYLFCGFPIFTNIVLSILLDCALKCVIDNISILKDAVDFLQAKPPKKKKKTVKWSRICWLISVREKTSSGDCGCLRIKDERRGSLWAVSLCWVIWRRIQGPCPGLCDVLSGRSSRVGYINFFFLWKAGRMVWS